MSPNDLPSREEIAQMRRSYGEVGLADGTLPADPLEGLLLWLADARANPIIVEPNAMVLATVGADGTPSTRTVLLKSVDARGLTFFTNYQSRKGRDLAAHPVAAVTFPWYPMERQISVIGPVERLPRQESEAYFASRPWENRIGAVASDQSRPLAARADLERQWREAATRYPDEVPMPAEWGGYLLTPTRIEFWQGRYSRLHDRIVFTRGDRDAWYQERLQP